MMNITLEGKTFPVRANMRAWRNFETATGNKVATLDTTDVTKMPELLFYFVQEGCKKQGMTFDMSCEDFLAMVDVADLARVMEIIEASMSPEKKTPTTPKKARSNGTK